MWVNAPTDANLTFNWQKMNHIKSPWLIHNTDTDNDKATVITMQVSICWPATRSTFHT